jgi:Plavaka transposase
MPPPPPDHERSPNDWAPYENQTQFETAEFLYTQNQMSAGDINDLLKLWGSTLANHNDKPPFLSERHLYDTIDATQLGDVKWESFSLRYNDISPHVTERSEPDNVPSWKSSQYEVWYRDPHALVKNMLANPDFKDDFDYAPFQEYASDGNHRFHDLMSGDWSWRQAVS